MCVKVRHDLVSCEVLDVLLAGGDRTGLPMDSLVSYEEEDTLVLMSE